ncbi:hypothetical protein TNIN_67981 [Trichonephila inaurata madagascariensis]|uniref:Uncharacterized protein n=1 Tax=Trichonephila inaurata madagascariensis TaxID=2747483 RepID=A0A8X6X4E2_9ARAC|nr:hypothetical protein TNIN_67981 [Trichonephila inaurata madagascariensis]
MSNRLEPFNAVWRDVTEAPGDLPELPSKVKDGFLGTPGSNFWSICLVSLTPDFLPSLLLFGPSKDSLLDDKDEFKLVQGWNLLEWVYGTIKAT